MNLKSLTFAITLAVTAIAAPALAQRSSAKPGNYIDIQDIKVLPGQYENYMDFLKANWVKQNEWAKQKGYIVSYRVLENTYPRENEPTLFLMTEYTTFPDAAEQQRRSDEYVAFMKMDEHAMDAASEKRGPMRTRGSTTMLQEVLLK